MENMYNLNIERALLSAILFEPYGEDSEYLLNHVSPSDFYLPFHQYYFTSCQDLHQAERPIDEEFIRISLVKSGHFDEVAMVDVMSTNPISNTRGYIHVLKEKAQKRGLVTMATEIKKLIIEDDELPAEVIEHSIKMMERVAENGTVKITRKSMADAEESAPEFICKSWLPIPKYTLTMFVATGGTGKTWLSLQLAIRMAREDAGRKIFLWLSEDPEGTVKSRYNTIIKEIVRGKRDTEDVQIDISTEDPMLLLETRGKTANMSSKFYTMKRELREYDVIMIDPLLAFFGGDENDNSQARVFMQPFLNWARNENKSIIFLHHSKKGEGNNASRARGAGALVDAVRCVYDMDKIYINKSGEKKLDPISTHMRKLSLTKDNYGAIQHLQSFEVEREITPSKSAPSFEVEYEDCGIMSMPRID